MPQAGSSKLGMAMIFPGSAISASPIQIHTRPYLSCTGYGRTFAPGGMLPLPGAQTHCPEASKVSP